MKNEEEEVKMIKERIEVHLKFALIMLSILITLVGIFTLILSVGGCFNTPEDQFISKYDDLMDALHEGRIGSDFDSEMSGLLHSCKHPRERIVIRPIPNFGGSFNYYCGICGEELGPKRIWKDKK